MGTSRKVGITQGLYELLFIIDLSIEVVQMYDFIYLISAINLIYCRN